MALFKEVKSLQIIPSYLMQPLKANSSTHLAKSQIDLLARLLRDLGTEGSGFTVGDVMEVSAKLPGPPCQDGAWSMGNVTSVFMV